MLNENWELIGLLKKKEGLRRVQNLMKQAKTPEELERLARLRDYIAYDLWW